METQIRLVVTAASVRGSNGVCDNADQPSTHADTVAEPNSLRARHNEGRPDTNSRQPRHIRDLGKEVRKPLPAEAVGEAERNNQTHRRQRR